MFKQFWQSPQSLSTEHGKQFGVPQVLVLFLAPFLSLGLLDLTSLSLAMKRTSKGDEVMAGSLAETISFSSSVKFFSAVSVSFMFIMLELVSEGSAFSSMFCWEDFCFLCLFSKAPGYSI